MISSFFGTFFFKFQDKEKEQGLSSKIIMPMKKIFQRSVIKTKGLEGNIHLKWLCRHGNYSSICNTSTGKFSVVVRLVGVSAWPFELHIKSLTSTGEKMHLTQQLLPQVIYVQTGWGGAGWENAGNPSHKQFVMECFKGEI